MRFLILAPHPDDEILGCTSLIQQALQAGDAVRVVVVSDGALAGTPQQRQAEARAGLAALGLAEGCDFWGYPDGALPQRGPIQQQYRQLVAHWQPTHIALPAPSENHPDHRRLTRGALAALAGQWQGELLFYETTTPLTQCNRILPLDLQAQQTALACHASQLSQYDYQRHAQGMAWLRGASIHAPAGQAYLAYPWDGTPQNFFDQRPLISVVLRADDAALASHALHSLRAQTYDHHETIVVWHGSEPLPEFAEFFDLDLRVLRGPGPRAANLNAGVQAAGGGFIAFLDQDDVLLPEHLASLLAELQADPGLDIAHGDYREAVCRYDRAQGQVQVLSTQEVPGRNCDPGRLLAGNLLPLHSFLSRRRLVEQLGFDETLEAYEDWEFLTRAELSQVRLGHVAEVLCEYRIYPQAGEPTNIAALHERKGYTIWRQAVLQRILQRFDLRALDRLTQLATDLEAERNGLRAERDGLRAELALARQQADQATRTLQQLHDWAQRLSPDQPATDPLQRLAGAAFSDGPVIALVLPVCDPEPAFLLEALHSVQAQAYPHWRLTLADDASTQPAVLALLDRIEQLSRQDPRIQLMRRSQRGGIVAASRSAIEQLPHSPLPAAQWLAFLDHDDRLPADSLLQVAAAIRRAPQVQAFYTDSRMIDRNGGLLHSFHKPQWSPETMLHLNYVNHLSVIRRDAYQACGGLRPGYDGSQDWDLWLRLTELPGLQVQHIAEPLYDWRAAETSVAYSMAAKPYALDAACRTVTDHLQRRLGGIAASSPAQQGDGLRSLWPGQPRPLSVIIPTHCNAAGLARLLHDLQQQDYPAPLEVLVIANRVQDTATLQCLQALHQRPDVRVLVDDRAFNWSALNNAAARLCQSDWLLFLNDDVALPDPQTLRKLTRYLALDSAIGAVGAQLQYPEHRGGGLQHDGIVTSLELQRVAENITGGANLQGMDRGLQMPRNVSAVTGACLLTPRPAFERCGGFDERLAVSFNDVDYCLALRRNGLRIVQASDVLAEHDESRTRGPITDPAERARLLHEAQLLRAKWGELLQEKYRLNYAHRYLGSRIVAIPQD